MIDVYEETALTPLRVAQMSGYTDWSSQPSMFKHYPKYLYRYKFEDNEKLQVIEDARCITSKSEIGGKPYYRLNTPSAGNLHPIELYVQIRGIKGILSGIYHVDVGSSELVLIREVEAEGLESYVDLKSSFRGMIFIVSTVPFRAEWKYGHRAIRYCYLDAGHQVEAINASLKLHEQKMTILSDVDKSSLNEFMGFKDEEFVVGVLACGELKDKKVKRYKENLMYVQPTDYSELSDYMQERIPKNNLLISEVTQINLEVTQEDIYSRRSARFFEQSTSSQEKIEYMMALSDRIPKYVSCYTILLSESSKKAGVYLKGELIQEGVFAELISKILVDQLFVKNTQMIMVLTSEFFNTDKLMQVGAFVHNLYLEAQSQGLGCSGIGAFYDKQLQDFLSTDEYILYVSTVGVEKK